MAKLADLMNKPLKEVIEEMELVTCKPFTDDNGNIVAIELKYQDDKATVKHKEPKRW